MSKGLAGLVFLCCVAVLLAVGCGQSSNRGTDSWRTVDRAVILFENGQRFDGETFVSGSRYSVDGVLYEKHAGPVSKRFDLASRFVVPALGEAHNHNISRPPSADELKRYVEAGVFYVLILNNLLPPTPEASRAGSLSVAYANGGLTSPGGHVVELHERLVDFGVIPVGKEDLDGLAFFVVESEEDLDRQWRKLLAGRPDVIKIYLGASEEYLQRRDDRAFFGKRGLDPGLVPSIVRRAHEADLRVAAHIETAADFRIAVAARVDIIAHLPGWRIGKEAGFVDTQPDRWLLTPDDAQKAAASGVIVITTAIAGDAALDRSHAHHTIVRDIHRKNLQTLWSAGVRLGLGSDYWNGTSVTEAVYLAQEPVIQGVAPLSVFDNLTLVRLLAMDTPRAIFPNRRVGGLKEGDEASFLVLEGDPVVDLHNLLKIRMRVLRGEIIEVPPAGRSDAR